jgi:hypothetical protein
MYAVDRKEMRRRRFITSNKLVNERDRHVDQGRSFHRSGVDHLISALPVTVPKTSADTNDFTARFEF